MSLVSGTNYSTSIVGRRNAIINGNFDIWQRGVSQTTSAYGSDDRWYNNHTGSTKVASQQPFALGQTDVPNNPKYYSSTVVTSVAGVANYVQKFQKIEDARTFAGETVTLSFWAKADATKNIAIEFYQSLGTGGSPSTDVSGIDVTTHALTTTWQKFTATVTIPSVSGKVLGTDSNDSLLVIFWFDSGSDFNSRTNSLGQQSGTFDIAQVQIEKGDAATPFERRSYGEELALCRRYFQKFTQPPLRGVAVGTTACARMAMVLPTRMRDIPSLTVSGSLPIYDGNSTGTATTVVVNTSTVDTIEVDFNLATGVITQYRTAVVYQSGTSSLSADAEL